MKLLPFLFALCFQIGTAQVDVLNIQNDNESNCSGSAVVLRANQGVSGFELTVGSLSFDYEFESNSILVENLCPGVYTINYTINVVL